MHEMVNILITEPEYFEGDALRILKSIGRVKAKRMGRPELEKEIENTDVLVVRIETAVDSSLLRKAKRLKVIGSATTGLNHIDTKQAETMDIRIVNLHGMHTVPTAEHAFALMLSLCRKIPWAYENMRRGKWERYKFFGMQLEGKTLGVIGMGKIGSRVAGYGKAFGMNVVAFDPYVKESVAEMLQLPELLERSDIVTIHAMLTKETENMIGYEQLQSMKRTALLINTARERIVDEDALLKALSEGAIAGAAFDVFAKEPASREDPLLVYAKKNRNLLLTPHIGASTDKAIHDSGVEIANGVSEELKRMGLLPGKR